MNRKYLQIITISSFVFSSVALLLINNSKVDGYELSIYSGIPILSFLLVILSTVSGIYLILIKENPKSLLWRIGYLIILFNNIIWILLPVLRGYAFNERADVLTHIGYVIDINMIGYFRSDNFYPIVHILLSEISQITNLPTITIFRFSPSIFYIVFMLNMYFFARSIFENTRITSLVVASSSVLFLGKYLTAVVPNGVGDMFFPLILAIYFKKLTTKSMNFNSILVIFLIIFPLFHPLSATLLISVFIFIEFSKYITSKFILVSKVTINHILIVFITFLMWISSYRVWNLTIGSVSYRLFHELTNTPIDHMVTDLNKINVDFFGFIELFLKLYGITTFYIILSFIGIYYIGINIHKLDESFYKISTLSLCLIFLLAFFLLLFYIPFGFSAFRIVSYVKIISLVVGSFGLFKLIGEKTKNQYIGILLLLLLIPLTVGILTIHDSPWIIKPNSQITQNEVDGWTWFLEHKEKHIKVVGLMSSQPYRFLDLLYGSNEKSNRTDFEVWNPPVISDHFNYTEHSYIGNSYPYSLYTPISEYDQNLYTGVWKAVGRYNETDFEMLKQDKSASLFYSNNGFYLWYINPQ